MKKLKICFLFLLSMAFVFTGCAGMSGYLKTAETNLSVASFYHNNYLTGFSIFQNAGNDSSVITSEADRLAFSGYTNALHQTMPEEKCFIAVLDYLYEINNSTNASVQKVKVKPYEFRTVLKSELLLKDSTSDLANNYSNLKAVILLERADKTSLEVNTYLFYFDNSYNYEISDLQNNLQNAAYNFTFVQTGYNVQTKTFSLKYETNSTATATFNQEKGNLTYSLNTFIGSSQSEISLTKSIYEYSNGVSAIRVISRFGTNGQNKVVVYEQTSSDFFNRAKVGEVKDVANMLSLDTMPEDKLSAVNSSDDKGYLLTYDQRRDDSISRIICENYGLNA